MGQIPSGRRTTFLILHNNTLSILLTGEYRAGEPDVGLVDSFEPLSIEMVHGNPLDLLEWAEAQHGALDKLQELALENIQTA